MSSSLSISSTKVTPKPNCNDKLCAAKEGAEIGASQYAGTVSTARYVHEALKPVTKAYSQVSYAFLPFRATALGTTPFEIWNLAEAGKEIVEAPGSLKILPILKSVNASGVILDQFCTSVEIAAAYGAQGIEVLTAVGTPLGIVAVGLQLAGAAVTGWTLHEIRKEWNAVEKMLKKKGKVPNLENYREAVERLTKEAASRKEKFKQKFFGLLTDGQKGKLKAIYDKSQESNDTLKLEKAFKSVKQHVKTKTVDKVVMIALAILASIAMIALFFVIPSPVSILCWSVMAIAGIGGLASFIHGVIEKRRLSHSLSQTLKQP